MIKRTLLAGIVIAIAIFINLPAPPLSDRLTGWKKKGRFETFKGWNIFFVDEKGSGPSGTLICLHGFPTSSYDWIKVLPQLKNLFSRIIMLDFVGYGFSDKPRSHTYTIKEQADVVEDLALHLGVKASHILSHDYGDTVALELLARHNTKQPRLEMLSLTMLNGGVFPDTHHPRPVQKLLLMPVFGFIASHLYSFPMFCRGFGEIFGTNKPTKEDNEDFWAAIRYNDGDKATYKIINFLRERQEFKERWVGALQKTQLKVLMIYGPADPVNPPEFAVHFKKTVPGQSIITLDSTIGHYPQWEDPAAVTDAFTKFINQLASV